MDTSAATSPLRQRHPVQQYARAAGLLFLLSMLAGFFGEVYVPSKIIVSGDAAATARNIVAPGSPFGLGFASYLVEALCDVALSLVFYVLLRPVQKHVALLAAFFGLVSTSLYAVAELAYYSSAVILRSGPGLKAWTPEQLHALAMLALQIFQAGSGIVMVFFGVATLLRGYLAFRSTYLPRFLGAIWMMAGAGFIVRTFVLVLAPRHASNLFLVPMFVAGLTLTIWFLVKGVDVEAWEKAIGTGAEERV